MKDRYVIITPVYNEEESIQSVLDSVTKQTILPVEWVIINDGSTDSTAQIIKSHAINHDWIKLLDLKKQNLEFGTIAVVLFYKGYDVLINKDFDYIVKLDADINIDRPDFFEYQLIQFDKDPMLGISSGITYSMKNGQKQLNKRRPYWRTGGATKMYRKKCLDEIDGIKPIYGWDGLDEYQAMFKKWRTRTFFDLHVNHLSNERMHNRSNEKALIEKKGISLYKRGYPIEFIIVKFFTYSLQGPSKGFAFIRGYISALRLQTKRLVTKEEMRFFRKIQYLRIADKFTKKQLL